MAGFNETETSPGVNTPKDDDPLMETFLAIFNFYIPCVLMCLGFIGNTLTFIIMTQRLRKRQNVVISYHFRALAIGDNGMLILGMAQRVILDKLPSAFENYGDFLCKEFYYTLFVSFGVHVWNVIIISVDRFVAVRFPLKAAAWCTVKKARACYVFNLCFHLVFNAVKLWKYYQKGSEEICVNPPEFQDWFENFILMFYYGIVNYAPPIIVLILNVSILIKFRRKGKKLKDFDDEGAKQKKEGQERNLTLMMMVVAFAFIFCLACYPFDDILWSYVIPHVAVAYPKLRELCFYIFNYMTDLDSCINFYIYLLVSASIRTDFLRLIGLRHAAKHLR